MNELIVESHCLVRLDHHPKQKSKSCTISTLVRSCYLLLTSVRLVALLSYQGNLNCSSTKAQKSSETRLFLFVPWYGSVRKIFHHPSRIRRLFVFLPSWDCVKIHSPPSRWMLKAILPLIGYRCCCCCCSLAHGQCHLKRLMASLPLVCKFVVLVFQVD